MNESQAKIWLDFLKKLEEVEVKACQQNEGKESWGPVAGAKFAYRRDMDGSDIYDKDKATWW